MFLLILAAMIWGLGFMATRWLLQAVDPSWGNSVRYVLAGLVSLPFLIYFRSFHNLSYFKKAVIPAIFLWASMHLQTVGLVYTSIAKSGFITALYAIFVPVLGVLVLKQKEIDCKFWPLLFFALVGVLLLCDLSLEEINRGDIYTLGCALFAAAHILAVDRVPKDMNAFEFNATQSIIVGFIGVVYSLVFYPIPDFHFIWNWGDLFTGSATDGVWYLVLFSTLVGFTIQVHCQKSIRPHTAGMIFLMESPFAAFFAYIFLGEKLNHINILGALFILVAVYRISQIKTPKVH
jgi:drug/metabolite transporter (DMT)-like permease